MTNKKKKPKTEPQLSGLKSFASFAALSSPCLAGPINVGVHHAHVPGQGIVPGEGLLFGAQMTSHLLFARVVDRVFMTGEVIGT